MPDVELYWRVHWYEERFAGEALVRSTIEDGRRLLSTADQVAVLQLLVAGDGLAGLRVPADVAACWDRLGGSLDAGLLNPLIAAHPALRPALLAAGGHVATLTGVPRAAMFSGCACGGRREAWVQRLADWDLRGPREEVVWNVRVVGLLLTPPNGRATYGRRHLMPPLDHTDEIYGLRARPGPGVAVSVRSYTRAR